MKKKIGVGILGVFIVLLILIMNIDKLMFLFMGIDIEYAKFKVDGDNLIMNGIIYSETPKDIKKILIDNPNVKNIIMENVPGSIDDIANLEASRIVRKYGLNTYVPSYGMIASGGTDFFCAGVERKIDDGAEIGVHSWAGDGVKDASNLPKDHPEHEKYIDYYKEMGIPEDFYWFTIQAANANEIYIMSKEELTKYKLIQAK